ncbi:MULTISPECIES: hypothetical protein [unclassified Curtobacterium]|uniref:hypothetical protein n=1 Tax=unclassified Curtobacterium TaxID=257496 RepID=UPI0039AED590
MPETKTVRCYIDEYEVSPGRIGARLREKDTGRIVVLGFAHAADKQEFLQFLSGVARMRTEVPDAFDKTGEADAVEVSGEVDFDAPDELRFAYNDRLQYTVA